MKQLATDIFDEGSWLEFNLSQFDSPRDLMGPFHQARDLVLGGITPVVFWDEFDSRDYQWLQYLGSDAGWCLQDGQLSHAVGKAVFVFAGGTSPTYATFGPQRSDENGTKISSFAKVPIF